MNVWKRLSFIFGVIILMQTITLISVSLELSTRDETGKEVATQDDKCVAALTETVKEFSKCSIGFSKCSYYLQDCAERKWK